MVLRKGYGGGGAYGGDRAGQTGAHGRDLRRVPAPGVPVRPGRDAHRQRVPARHRLAGRPVGDRHRPVGVAYPPADRDERRAVRVRAAARDRAVAVQGRHRPAPARARRAVPRADGHGHAAARRDGSARLPDRRGRAVAIATSGYAATARPALGLLGLPEDTPMVTRDLVRHAKPDPDLFLAAAALLDIEPRHAFVVGDSVWDLLAARRAGALGVGLLSGGYGREELERAGAYRVYADPAEMLARIDELGVRTGAAT